MLTNFWNKEFYILTAFGDLSCLRFKKKASESFTVYIPATILFLFFILYYFILLLFLFYLSNSSITYLEEKAVRYNYNNVSTSKSHVVCLFMIFTLSSNKLILSKTKKKKV